MKLCMKASLWKQVRKMLPASVGTIVMLLTGMLLQRMGTSMLWQFTGVAICMAVYLAVCFLFFKKQSLSALDILGFKINLRKK